MPAPAKTTVEALGEMENLLELEREAIRTLDSAAIVKLSEDKEALLALLRTSASDHSFRLDAGVRKIFSGLRRNGVLLAHARDTIRDALAASTGQWPQTSGGEPTKRPRTRFSVTG